MKFENIISSLSHSFPFELIHIAGTADKTTCANTRIKHNFMKLKYSGKQVPKCDNSWSSQFTGIN